MKLTQCDVILKAMLENKGKTVWSAKDFQEGKYFVGYEASARMSDLVRLHPDILVVGKEGRFRTLSINWEQDLSEYFKMYDLNLIKEGDNK